jgi:hypothetical protein
MATRGRNPRIRAQAALIRPVEILFACARSALEASVDRERWDMASRKTFLKFYTGDHKRLGDPTSPGAFYAVQTVIHTSPAEDGLHVRQERTVWLLSDPTIRAGLPTMSAVRKWINAKWMADTTRDRSKQD